MSNMYFIGVDTRASAVHRLFGRWAALLGADGARLEGLDAPPGAPREVLRRMATQVAADPDSRGALVTTHKVGIFESARDLFTDFNDDARLLGEVGCIVRGADGLHGLAIDTFSCAIPILEITGGGRIGSEVLIFGAGGAGRAIAVYLAREHSPARIIVTDVDQSRLAKTHSIAPVETHAASENDRVLSSLGPGALIINATGLGKDLPGSPITDSARFPDSGIAWDLNYRGNLIFLEQARRQRIRTADGWVYFISGWMNIMARVFGAELNSAVFEQARAIAAETVRTSAKS